jgi:GntR family transcriptional regulator of arabinose operon
VNIKPFSDYDLLPVYMRVADDLRAKLGGPNFEVGSFLPSEHDLVKAYNLSRGTIRKALDILAAEGLISRQTGRGTIILPPPARDQQARLKIAVLWSIVRWIGADMLGIIEDTLSNSNCDILFSTSQHDPLKEAEILERLLHTDLDGLILYATGDEKNQDLIHAFAESRIPIVLLDRFTPALVDQLSWVSSDNVQGAYDLTRHLIELGHEQIAFVTWTPDNEMISTLLERRLGYEKALAEAGLKPLMLLQPGAATGQPEKDEFSETLFQFIDIHQPTAIFFHNDATVYRLYPVFQEWGMRIPEDISIAGFDGLEIQFGFAPIDLTTVKQDFSRLGHEAAQSLLNLIERPHLPPIHMRVPVTLHIGNTTAPPKCHQK